MSSVRDIPNRINARLEGRPKARLVLCAALIAVMAGLQWLQLDLSCVTLRDILSRKIVYLFLNCGMMLLVDLALFLLTMRWHVAFFIGNVLLCGFGIANYYTLALRGEPITVGLISSLGTALDVIGGYRFHMAWPVVFSLLVLAVNTLLAVLLKWVYPGQRSSVRRFLLGLGGFVLLGGCVAGSFFMLDRLDPIGGWFPFETYSQYQGYPVYVVRQQMLMVDPVKMPEGYTDEAVAALAEADDTPAQPVPEQMPDLIFILNETFYDLEDFTDLDADVPYMENWYARGNSVKGRAVVSLVGVGGGTNASEFELLTSNSTAILSPGAPFQLLNMSDRNSLVTVLKDLGYTTWAMHPCAPGNYGRGHAYPAMGFDEWRFRDDFTGLESYGERLCTDESTYRNMIDWYESSGDGPRMMFLLTYQNHGGWEQNDASYDTVHTGRDFGGYTDDLDEFLTSIRLSDQALEGLLDYFDTVDRPVLVCMVGDHSPYIIKYLSPRESLTAEESDLASRSTPFMIWANKAFGTVETRDIGSVSMVDLAPMVMDMAGLPLTPYYRTVLELSRQIPVRMSSGRYYTADGQTGFFEPGDSRFDQLAAYYYMEYNNLLPADRRVQSLFALPED